MARVSSPKKSDLPPGDKQPSFSDPEAKNGGAYIFTQARVIIHNARPISDRNQNDAWELFKSILKWWLILSVLGGGTYIAYLLNLHKLIEGYIFEDLKKVFIETENQEKAAELEEALDRMKAIKKDIPKGAFVYDTARYAKHPLLNITSIPEADLIQVNGKTLVDQNGNNMKTPLKNFRLPPGTYRMSFTHSGLGKSRTETVKVNPSQDVNLTTILIKKQFNR